MMPPRFFTTPKNALPIAVSRLCRGQIKTSRHPCADSSLLRSGRQTPPMNGRFRSTDGRASARPSKRRACAGYDQACPVNFTFTLRYGSKALLFALMTAATTLAGRAGPSTAQATAAPARSCDAPGTVASTRTQLLSFQVENDLFAGTDSQY